MEIYKSPKCPRPYCRGVLLEDAFGLFCSKRYKRARCPVEIGMCDTPEKDENALARLGKIIARKIEHLR